MKNLLFSLLAVISVFGTYFFLISYDPLVPFLWSLLFIYLYGKKHLYIALNSYFILLLILYADKLNFDVIGIRSQFAYSSLALLVTFMFVFVYQELAGKRGKIATVFSYVVATVLYVVPLSFIIYNWNFGTQITDEAVNAAAQSNMNESIEFIVSSFSPFWLVVILAVAVLIGYLLLKQEKKETEKIEKSLLLFIMVVFASIVLLHYKEIRLYSYLKQGAENYKQALAIFKKTKEKRKVVLNNLQAEKKEEGETYIVIIGESLNKHHMGVYGYFRDTTPLLTKAYKKDGMLRFDNAYSNHTHTMEVLSQALTEANQQNGKKYFDSFSIVDILNRAGFETYWLSNQVMYGTWDNLVSIMAHDADHLVSLNHTTGQRVSTQHYDDVLVGEVKKVLEQKTKKNRVIFVHLMGSHVDYASRYPAEKYTVFDGDLNKSVFGDLAGISWERRIKDLLKHRTPLKQFLREASGKQRDDINHYDNSVRYNDEVVGSILKLLEAQNGVRGFVYMSDHADDVIGGLGHNASVFTYEMSQIPLLVWLSPEYREKYPHKYSMLKQHSEALFSNDLFYDTLVGIFDVNTTHYNPEWDLSAPAYTLDADKALVLHGKKHYTDKQNTIWWQKENVRYLVEHNLSSRIFPHRVDSVGKLKDVWNAGFRSFEVDVIFNKQSGKFEVGHDEGVMDLAHFLSWVDYAQIQRIWLDFKNLNADNYKVALQRLEMLDKKYGIKKKSIVESHMKPAPVFETLHNAGWHTSCYLSTATITKLLQGKDESKMKQEAERLAKQLNAQHFSAVSFDRRLYPFVKQHLEPLLEKEMVYHTWWGPNLYDADFVAKLQKDELFKDDRVKTILCRFKSKYDY